MRICILGGAGVIGKSLHRLLLQNGHDVDSVDIKNSVAQDLRDSSLGWAKSIKSADFVYFLAFDVGGSKYLERYEHQKGFLDNNLKIMLNTFEALEEQMKPFIFITSQMSSMNHSPYGILKRVGEFYTNSLKAINVKLWNVYGPDEDLDKSHVINDFVRMAKLDGVIRMRTDGKELRQFLHSDDCAAALYRIMKIHPEIEAPTTFDLTSFEWTSILSIAEKVANLTNASIILGESSDSVQRDKKNEPSRKILDYWAPTKTLETGIAEIITEDYS